VLAQIYPGEEHTVFSGDKGPQKLFEPDSKEQ
jgi:hypothetical protein